MSASLMFACAEGAFAAPADCSAAAAAASLAASGPTPFSADTTAMPGKGFVKSFGWINDIRRSYWKRRAEDRCSVVFIGDSLVQQWTTLKQDFAPLKVANRGIGGDGSRGVLIRFEEDALDLAPKAVVILIGTNDLSAKQSVADIVFNIRAMITQAAARDPAMPVLLCTLPPRQDARAPIDSAELLELNRQLRALVAGKPRLAVVDLYGPLATDDGRPDPRFFQPDLLHLNADAYARFKVKVSAALDGMNLH